jgi:hypothetical protein
VDGYAVKVEELGKLIGDLDTAADRMADANKKLGGGGAFGSLGNAELGKAGVEFEEAWGYGIGRLGEAAEGITERLKQAKQKYARIEAEFGGELRKFGSAVPGSGDGPVGGGITGGMPGIGEPADQPGDGPVGGGRTGGVPGVGDLAGTVGGGYTGGVPGIDQLGERSVPDRPVGGGATGGITDILNGLGR